MSEVIIDGKVYKEVKIVKFTVDGEDQETSNFTADQLEGKAMIHITIQTETNTSDQNNS